MTYSPTIEEQHHLVALTVRIASRHYKGNNGNFDELVSAGLVGAAKAIQRFTPERDTPFMAFAALCIGRKIIQEVNRERQRRVPLSVDEIEETFGPVKDPEPRQYEEPLDMAKLFLCLTPRQREIFELHYRQGLSFRQIAQRLGCRHQNVAQVHTYGVARLRARYGSKQENFL